MAMTQVNCASHEASGVDSRFSRRSSNAVGVRRVGAGVSCGAHARLAAEGINFQTGVVCQGQHAAEVAIGLGLQDGVVLEGVPGLLDIGVDTHVRE